MAKRKWRYTDFSKHGFGPGTDVCARCKGEKEKNRPRSKWCLTCNTEMIGKRGIDGALDKPRTSPKGGSILKY